MWKEKGTWQIHGQFAAVWRCGGLGLIPCSSHMLRTRQGRLEERISINHIHIGRRADASASRIEISPQCARIPKNKTKTHWIEKAHEKGHQNLMGVAVYALGIYLHIHTCVYTFPGAVLCFGFPISKKPSGIRRSSGTNSRNDCKHGRIFLWREVEQIVVILFRKEMNERRHNRGT